MAIAGSVQAAEAGADPGDPPTRIPAGHAAVAGPGPEAGTVPLVFMFPGQSSRCREMLRRAQAAGPAAQAVIDEASDILARDLSEELSAGNSALFGDNHSIQIGVFLVSEIYRRELAAQGIRPAMSLGLSLGEYNHLVEIGALEFADALRLVDVRGRLYSAGPPGLMISLTPADEGPVAHILAEVGDGVEISNFNSPSQLVIAGPRESTRCAAALFEEREFGQATVIEDRIPMHTSRFRPVADELRPHLESAPWRDVTGRYLANLTGTPVLRPEPRLLIESLYRHVFSPVQWRRCIEAVLAMHPHAIFVEVGPKRVLCNLLGRRWVRNERLSIDDQGIDVITSRLRPCEAATS